MAEPEETLAAAKLKKIKAKQGQEERGSSYQGSYRGSASQTGLYHLNLDPNVQGHNGAWVSPPENEAFSPVNIVRACNLEYFSVCTKAHT